MKKLYIIACSLLAITSVSAQVDRSHAPKASAAREIKIGEYQSFTLKNGLQVFVVENHKLPRVQFGINLKNNPILEGEKAGYVSMAGDLIGTGTKTRSKAQLDEEVDFIGASLNTSPTGITASSLSKHTAKLLDLMSDVLYNPSFAPEELEKLKTQTLSSIAAGKDNPSSIAANVRGALVYGKNHPYGEIVTEKSVGAITLDDCKAYYNTYFKPNNAYLIIVGDIDLKNGKLYAEKYFSKWIAGDVKNPTYIQPASPAKTFVALVDRAASVQSVINISYPVDLRPGSMESIKARVTNEILGGGFSSRLMQNLREKHAFTYGARSTISSDPLIGNFNASASVRNAVTDSSVYEFVSELRRIVNEPVTEKELSDAKATISGSFGRSLESPQTVAGFALNTAKYNLPKDYYNNYLKSVDVVTISDVQATAKALIKPENAYIIVVGKGADIADKLTSFGEIKYYDIEGNNYVPSKSSALPAGLTAEKVIANYIDALGGLKKVQEVKAIKSAFKATAGGMEIMMAQTKRFPNKSVTEITGNGMTFMKAVSDGQKVSIMQMGNKVPMDDKMKEATLFESAIFKELGYSAIGGKAMLTGIEQVNGKEAYVIEFTLKAGEKFSEYFDKESGLKVQEVTSMTGPQGNVVSTVQYLDYKDVNGVKFPQAFTQSEGPMNFKFEVVSQEVNKPVDDKIFKVE
jgi:zinc protease